MTAMKDTRRFALLAALLLLAQVGCAPVRGPLPDGYVPPLALVGDLQHPTSLDRASAEAYRWDSVELEGRTLPCLALSQLLEEAAPFPAAFMRLLLVGGDGRGLELLGDAVAEVRIAFSETAGWVALAGTNPAQPAAQSLTHIVVECQSGDHGLRFLTGDYRNGSFLTAGGLLGGNSWPMWEYDGPTDLGGLQAAVYETRLWAASELEAGAEYAVVLRDGGLRRLRPQREPHFEASGNHVDLALPGEGVLQDVAGLVADPPARCLTDLPGDVLGLLAQGQPVLVLLLDGWGWRMAEQAGVSGGHPHLSSLPLQRAMAVYPTCTPAGLDSLLTGETPDVHGLTAPEQRSFAGEDLFAKAAARGFVCAYVEDEGAPVDTSLEARRAADQGGPFGADDEVFALALQAAAEGPDLLVVRFGGIGSVALETGPYSLHTLNRMRQVDGYVEALRAAWPGAVVVTSGHGVAELPVGGRCGELTGEEFFVPYCLLEGPAH